MKALASRLDEGRAAWAGWSITASSSRLSRSVQEPGPGEAASCSTVQYSSVQFSTGSKVQSTWSVQEPGPGEAASWCSSHLLRLNSQWYLHSAHHIRCCISISLRTLRGAASIWRQWDDSVKIWTADGVIIKCVILESAATNRRPLPGDHGGAQQQGGEGGPEPGHQQGHQQPHPPGYRALVELS